MSDDFDAVLRKFRREVLGPMVAHMTEEQLDAWISPFEAAYDMLEADPEPPKWWQKQIAEQRARLLGVLRARSER